jgi:hypothetical protein
MGVSTSEVGYTLATTRRVTTKFIRDMWSIGEEGATILICDKWGSKYGKSYVNPLAYCEMRFHLSLQTPFQYHYSL